MMSLGGGIHPSLSPRVAVEWWWPAETSPRPAIVSYRRTITLARAGLQLS
jgi:hypothetical protein